ncbi:MAG: CDP-alcohol phosphatidyltransferase family protein [Mycobacteriales bacterium]
MPTVRSGPLTGLVGQLVLTAALAGTVGLGPAAALAGGAFGLVLCALLTRGLGGSGLGPADQVTLIRATLVGGVTALTVEAYVRPVPAAPLVALASVALALDWVDGRVARGTGTVSVFGARFDMEVDAFLILVLSAYAARPLGAWVLAVGALRYAYGVAGWVLPWLPGPLPARPWRKVVAAIQGMVLVVAAAGVLPRPVAAGAVAVALALLVESFGRDVGWRWRRRELVPGGPVRRGRHADPADRQRRGPAAPRGVVPWPRQPGPGGRRPGLAAGARPQ